MRAFLIAMAIALGGCSSHNGGYTRTDGVPVDPLHQQSTLAQCKGEGVSGAVLTDGTIYGSVAQANKEKSLSMLAWRGMVTFTRSSE